MIDRRVASVLFSIARERPSFVSRRSSMAAQQNDIRFPSFQIIIFSTKKNSQFIIHNGERTSATLFLFLFHQNYYFTYLFIFLFLFGVRMEDVQIIRNWRRSRKLQTAKIGSICSPDRFRNSLRHRRGAKAIHFPRKKNNNKLTIGLFSIDTI